MSLDLAKLENARRLPDGRIRARCPACAAEGHDKRGEHLIVNPNGAFGCAVHPGETVHRKSIWALAGSQTAKPIEVRSLGRLGRVNETPIVLQRNILGRLGRLEQSHAGSSDAASKHDSEPTKSTPNLNGFSEGVPRVPRLNANECVLPPDQAVWLPVAHQILCGEFDQPDKSTVESLTIGLRNIPHPLARRALELLRGELV